MKTKFRRVPPFEFQSLRLFMTRDWERGLLPSFLLYALLTFCAKSRFHPTTCPSNRSKSAKDSSGLQQRLPYLSPKVRTHKTEGGDRIDVGRNQRQRRTKYDNSGPKRTMGVLSAAVLLFRLVGVKLVLAQHKTPSQKIGKLEVFTQPPL